MSHYFFKQTRYKPLSAPIVDHLLLKPYRRLAFYHDLNGSPKFIWLEPNESMNDPTKTAWIIGAIEKD